MFSRLSTNSQQQVVLFLQAAFQQLLPKPVALHGVVVTKGQDPAIGLVKPCTAGLYENTNFLLRIMGVCQVPYSFA